MEQTRDVTEGVNLLSEKLGEYLDEEVVTNMTEIATAVNATKEQSLSSYLTLHLFVE